MKIYKILGKRGRITIPLEFRIKMGFAANDVLTFEDRDDNTVIIHREKLCNDRCSEVHPVDKPYDKTTLLEFLNGLSFEEKRAALIHLSIQLAMNRRNGGDGR